MGVAFALDLQSSVHSYIEVDGHDVSCFTLSDGMILAVDKETLTLYNSEEDLHWDRPVLWRWW